MRAGPQAQSEGMIDVQRVARNEKFDLIITGESRSERVEPLSSIFVPAGEWENGLVVECGAA